jgi:hypothetical protein
MRQDIDADDIAAKRAATTVWESIRPVSRGASHRFGNRSSVEEGVQTCARRTIRSSIQGSSDTESAHNRARNEYFTRLGFQIPEHEAGVAEVGAGRLSTH